MVTLAGSPPPSGYSRERDYGKPKARMAARFGNSGMTMGTLVARCSGVEGQSGGPGPIPGRIPGAGWLPNLGAGDDGKPTHGLSSDSAVCADIMNDDASTALRAAVEDAIALFRGNASRFRAALSPVIDSLEALCASLQQSVANAEPADSHAAVLVVTRDLITAALCDVAGDSGLDNRAVMLALATLHNRIVAALDACTVPRA